MIATTLRIDEQSYEKIAVLADKEERSINSQILYILKTYIENYEKEHGVIEIKIND